MAGREACEGRNCSGRKRSAQEAYRSLGARRARAGTALALGAKCAGRVQAQNEATYVERAEAYADQRSFRSTLPKTGRSNASGTFVVDGLRFLL